VKVTRFDTRRDLIFVPGFVWSAHGEPTPLRFVVDTGAAMTIVVPDVLDELGYSAREHGEQVAVTRGVATHEQGYTLRVQRLSCLGFQEPDLLVYAQDLPSGWNIDGLLGLSFLRLLNYEVRSLEGRIVAERAMSQTA
jgi:predicted aspartyl protease